MSKPEPKSPFGAALSPGRHGAPSADPLRIAEVLLAAVEWIGRAGRETELAEQVRRHFGFALPGPGHSASTRDDAEVAGPTGTPPARAGKTVLWLKPATWLVLAAPGDLAADLTAIAGDTAIVIDQSFGLAAIEIAGGRARDALAKGCRIDLHPRVFGPGRAATTIVAQVSVTLVQTGPEPRYLLLTPATTARHFAEWLIEAAAEYGVAVALPTPFRPTLAATEPLS